MGSEELKFKVKNSIGSALDMKMVCRSILHEGSRVLLYRKGGSSTEKSIIREKHEVIDITDYFIVFKGLKTGVKKAYDYIDVYRGLTANGVSYESSYTKVCLMIRREDGERFF